MLRWPAESISIAILISLLSCATSAKRPAVPLPYEPRVGHFGCAASQPVTDPGTLPQWLVTVWSEETSAGPLWTAKLNAYDASDPKSIDKALHDCSAWMKLVKQKLRSGEIRRPLANEIKKQKHQPQKERPE